MLELRFPPLETGYPRAAYAVRSRSTALPQLLPQFLASPLSTRSWTLSGVCQGSRWVIVVWGWIWGSSAHRLKVVVCPIWRLIVPILGRELLLHLAQRPNTKDWLGFQARPASSTLCFPSEEIQFQTLVCFLVKWIARVPQPKANLSYRVALRISNASSRSLFLFQLKMLQADASLVLSFANYLCFDGRSGSLLSFVH